MTCSLVFDGHVIALGDSGAVIGRSASCKVMLDGASVSRRHARVVVKGDKVSVRDLGSVNGVVVNGERVQRERRLCDGDRILIGKHELLVMIGDSAPGESAAPSASSAVDAVERSGPPQSSPLATLWDDDGDAFEDGDKTILVESPRGVDTVESPHGDAVDNELARFPGSSPEGSSLSPGSSPEGSSPRARLYAVLEQAKSGQLEEGDGEAAAREALRLASVTRDTEWLDYTFDVFLATGEVFPVSLLDDLVAASAGLHSERLGMYIESLRSRETQPQALDEVLARLEAVASRMKTRRLTDGDRR